MMPSNPPDNRAQPERICLLRLSALGDVCHCIALVRALQQGWPGTAISWIIGALEHRLVEDLPGVEFIVVNKRDGLGALKGLRRQLAGRRFDWLLHAQVSLRANLLATQVKAHRRLGFDRARSREGHGWLLNHRIAAVSQQHQADAFLEFARFFELETDGINPAPPIPQSAQAFAREHQPEPGQAVLISPASSHAGRNWNAAAYAALADWVHAELKRPVILIGGPSARERTLANQIVAAARHPLKNLVGQDTIKEALAMLERAACLVSPDSGPVHFASALGTPVVGLYAATWSKRSGPRHSLELCVDRFELAAERFTGKNAADLPWGKRLETPGVMDLVDLASVKEKVLQALAITNQ
ncbi:MAG: glycosyltransferase family 9 protein [Wenzhouxiangella sp.]